MAPWNAQFKLRLWPEHPELTVHEAVPQHQLVAITCWHEAIVMVQPAAPSSCQIFIG